MKRMRGNHGAPFKFQVALAAVKADKTVAKLAEQSDVHPTQITKWTQQLLARTYLAAPSQHPTRRIDELHLAQMSPSI